MRPLDAYHGNHHTFWPRLSLRGRHSRRGLGASMPLDAPLPFRAPASLPLPGTSGADRAGVGSPSSPDLIPASVYEVAELLRRRR